MPGWRRIAATNRLKALQCECPEETGPEGGGMKAGFWVPRQGAARPVCVIGLLIIFLCGIFGAALQPAGAGNKPVAAKSEMVVAAHPLAAETAFSQPAESLALFFSRHCRAGAPPVGTPAQTFG